MVHLKKNIGILISILMPFWVLSQTSFGQIKASTNPTLPESYLFQEYVFPEPDDQGECQGIMNSSATIDDIFFSQTHRHSIGHPFFFIIGFRPALMQIAITGNGSAPDVKVEGLQDGVSLGEMCLKGPETLSDSIDLSIPNFEDYYSVTLPKSWIKDGLELKITVDNIIRTISQEELKIGPKTEMNLVEVIMDVMDYNTDPHNTPIITNFQKELASSIPASVIRFGQFPETLLFPEVIANNETEQLVRLKGKAEKEANGITSDGSINSIATLFLSNLHRSTGDYLTTVYFGNTLNLAPGGWGGGKSFVSFDFDDVFIHELGHALSLPHWGESAYNIPDPNEYQFLYPYGGANDDGGGKGESWNFIQDIYEFIDPTCQYDERGIAGLETSDAMQRNNHCLGQRSNSQGPWDGFGDFSALAMHRYLVGDSVKTGTVNYKGENIPYQFNMQDGFPTVSLENGVRNYTRQTYQPQDVFSLEESVTLPGEEQLNVPVYLVYGSAHESQSQANIVYKPIKFTGTLSPIIDLTDPVTFEAMKDEKYRDLSTRDITLKMTYADGSVLHALNPFHTYARAPYTWGFHIWRNDVCNFSLVVPGDKELLKVELFRRPFLVGNEDDLTEGNINNSTLGITAENFMDEAEYQAEYSADGPKTIGPNSIGNRVWHDLNKNGQDDFGEPGIEGVKIIIWGDSDGDEIPDGFGFLGFTSTDENGEFKFEGLSPGKYIVFVWSRDNWEPGEPLHGMISIPGQIDPNNDVNGDDNGRPGNLEFDGLLELDIASGIIELTANGEPLNDGDAEHYWFDYDPSGNMTVDFGFYFEDSCSSINADIGGLHFLCDDEFGNITLEPISGEGPYTYLWNTGDTISAVDSLVIGEYNITITDGLGCPGEFSVDILESPEIQFIIVGPDSLCLGDTSALEIEVLGGLEPISYTWVNGEGVQNSEILVGTYEIIFLDGNGCEQIVQHEVIEMSDIACISQTADLDDVNVSIFPNPFRSSIQVENLHSEYLTFELWSLNGQKLILRTLGIGRTDFEIANIPNGMYIGMIRDTTGRILLYEKLVCLE